MPELSPLINELAFPTGVVVAEDGCLFVTESGLDAQGRPSQGQVLHITVDGVVSVLASSLRAPVTGLCLHNAILYVSEGGCPGRISRIDPKTGNRTTILDNLPAGGDYHTNTPLIANDWLYFGQGAATNSGIASWDQVNMPWIEVRDIVPDLPGMPVRLAAVDGGNHAFAPYGSPPRDGALIPAVLPCTSAVMRCRLDGTELELVAWGLRNPFGLVQTTDGQILVIDLGINDRGSRPVRLAGSCLYALTTDQWYGWPDYAGGEPVCKPKFHSTRPGARPPVFLLENHDELGPPARPLLRFAPHSGPTKMIVEPDGTLLITLFGDKRPLTGAPGPRMGRKVVRADLTTGTLSDLKLPVLQRPIDLARLPDGDLLILDFGAYEIDNFGRKLPSKGSGALWRIPDGCLSLPCETLEAV